MAATIGWSYGLLDPDSRLAFATLGVFGGPFTVAAAARVTGINGEHETIAMLERLADASLVSVQHRAAQPTTFRLLETIRAYVPTASPSRAGRPPRSNDMTIDDVEVCRQFRDEMYGAGRLEATARIGTELAEFVAAWDRSVATDAESHALRHGRGALCRSQAIFQMGQRDHRADRADAGPPDPGRSRGMVIAGWIVVAQNDVGLAGSWTTECPLPSSWCDRPRLAPTRQGRPLGVRRGDFEPAMALLTESLEMCDRIGPRPARLADHLIATGPPLGPATTTRDP